MPWCPKCKSEYRDGFTVCADCGSTLVSEQPADDVFENNVEPSWELEVETYEEEPEENEKKSKKKGSIYQDSADRADENRSSAWVLLFLGAVGLVFVALCIVGVIPLTLGNSYLFYGVMGAVFVLFIVAGFVSLKNAKFFEEKAESENSLKSTLLEWCKDNLDATEIDGRVGFQGIEKEVLYFRRFAYIKEKMNHQFVNLDQEFLDKLIDDIIYESVFED